jgi:phosphoglycerate-specific signal transduction histidine kinase
LSRAAGALALFGVAYYVAYRFGMSFSQAVPSPLWFPDAVREDGMGLGLSISRTIVEAHGGQIRAENNPDGGATVRFALPIA